MVRELETVREGLKISKFDGFHYFQDHDQHGFDFGFRISFCESSEVREVCPKTGPNLPKVISFDPLKCPKTDPNEPKVICFEPLKCPKTCVSQRGDPLHFPNWPVWAFRFRSVRWLVVEKIPYAKFYFECERPYELL